MNLRVKLILAFFAVSAFVASHFAVYRWGHARAMHREAVACQQTHIDQLTAAMGTLQQITAEANDASLRMGKLISARQAADEKTTEELRNALRTTASRRVECVFDDSVLRILTAARDRANTAAAGGIDDPVPDDSGTGGQ